MSMFPADIDKEMYFPGRSNEALIPPLLVEAFTFPFIRIEPPEVEVSRSPVKSSTDILPPEVLTSTFLRTMPGKF